MNRTQTIVTSQTNPLAYMKAIATLVGTIVTGLLGVYTADTGVGQVLTVVAIIATALATWVVPNAVVVSGEVLSVEDESYEEAGGRAYATGSDDPLPFNDYGYEPTDDPM